MAFGFFALVLSVTGGSIDYYNFGHPEDLAEYYCATADGEEDCKASQNCGWCSASEECVAFDCKADASWPECAEAVEINWECDQSLEQQREQLKVPLIVFAVEATLFLMWYLKTLVMICRKRITREILLVDIFSTMCGITTMWLVLFFAQITRPDELEHQLLLLLTFVADLFKIYTEEGHEHGPLRWQTGFLYFCTWFAGVFLIVLIVVPGIRAYLTPILTLIILAVDVACVGLGKPLDRLRVFLVGLTVAASVVIFVLALTLGTETAELYDSISTAILVVVQIQGSGKQAAHGETDKHGEHDPADKERTVLLSPQHPAIGDA